MFILVALCSLALLWFAFRESPQQRTERVGREGSVRALLLAQLHDARDIEFRNLRGTCGEVRYITAQGVQVGFKRFVVMSDTRAWIEQADSRLPFSVVWQGECLR
ncbi:hypothetical protein [Pseudomonas citronellolis]|uniref:hypothetical protein n=1 Tax=Pseudomonas citronellolis TaxID=53408 RepID=UPI0023E3CBBE|nr:hypothetical protein [Pseudomonas citronellolis]MDF3931304.1 hypothetical protein [Pseudomonas citronellolis]